MARASVARAAVTMVAGSQEEGSGMAEIVTSVLGGGGEGGGKGGGGGEGGRWREVSG